ncbi:hypothetical protein [Zhongshania aliphaticivorans]|jgi:hypothetical protein|uniref:Uncharacterized protein n=1 Tax=Zhongshania aliphaticivorans TaxID=1470434 RepID=A0A127M9H6_9GAMM|nr:hypothetical protein [Zhongshania aliphaticivorans]AMO69828.1 hypothetical protein AZF00_16650 [Zhongshania aliphaticivorans]
MSDILNAELAALLDKRALVGISYYDINGDTLQQRMLAGTVVRVTANDGITLRQSDEQEFTIPSSTAPWFIAPAGNYKTGDGEAVNNPDYLVTWDVHRCQDMDKPEGEHQWWEWVANTTPPSVG